MSDSDLFLDAQHPTSQRFAVLEDNGTSAWLYLTKPDSREPVADAWVYNRVPAPPTKEIATYRGGPPPAAEGFASENAQCDSPEENAWSFVWAANGESVAVAKDGIPVAFIVAGDKSGFSRQLIKNGPWGSVWSDEQFETTFWA